MVGFFRNLSGKSWCIATIEWWYVAVYFPYFGVSLNIHPNRFKQLWDETSPFGAKVKHQ